MPLEESWIAPLEEPFDDDESGTYSRVLELALSAGVRLFTAEEADSAARYLLENGFVVLRDAVRGAALQALRRAGAQLIRRAEKRQPAGNRGEQRWSLGLTTTDERCVQPADNECICSVLQQLWQSEKFTLLCTGGDFSLPGAGMQRMHADVGHRRHIPESFAFRDFLELPTPPTIKVYLTLTAFDEQTGPPVFVPGSHLRYAAEDVPEHDPEGSICAFCPSGSAILMDLRVWHHGTPNRSQIARPMLSLHYAAPWYSENVLTKPNMYWRYHRGALSRSALLGLRRRARQLCSSLVLQRCEQCSCPADHARPESGWHKGQWYCESCWSEWQQHDRERSPPRELHGEAKM